MKKLFEFSIDKETEVEVPEITKDEKGVETKTIKKEIQKTPVKFFVKRPNRVLNDAAEFYRSTKFNEAVKNGILPYDLLMKRLMNDEGLLSDSEKKDYVELYEQLKNIQLELQKQELSKEEDSEAKKAKREELIAKFRDIKNEIHVFETSKGKIFDNTAEIYARNKTIFWWALFLAYKMNGDKEVPFFAGEKLEDKCASYDALADEEDQFVNQVINKFILVISIWYMSGLTDQKEIEKFIEENS